MRASAYIYRIRDKVASQHRAPLQDIDAAMVRTKSMLLIVGANDAVFPCLAIFDLLGRRMSASH